MGDLRGGYFASNKIRVLHNSFIRESSLNRRQVAKASLYRAIIKSIFTKVLHKIIYDSYEFTYRKLGSFQFIKFLPKIKLTEEGKVITNKPVNFKETLKARKESGNPRLFVYHDNEETGGFTYRVIWDKTRTAFRNKTFYVFKLDRGLKALIHEQILNGAVQARTVDIKL